MPHTHTGVPSPRARAALGAGGLLATLVAGVALPPVVDAPGWEVRVLRSVRLRYSSALWDPATFVRHLGSQEVAVMCALCLTVPLLALGRTRWALQSLAAVIVGSAGAELAKLLVRRQAENPGALAYPSAHTAAATAIGVSLAILVTLTSQSRGLRALSWVLALAFGVAVGWASMAQTGHHPADVLGGLMFGACAPVLVWGVADLVWAVEVRPARSPRSGGGR